MSLKTSIQSFIDNLNEEYQFKKQKANYLELDEEDALIIGTSQFGDVAFDKKKLLSDTRCLIVGTSGSGKSYFTRNIIETIYNAQFRENDGSPVKNKIIQIHDPEGEFFTLREDGQFDFLVFGRGEDCDVEINADNAAEFALKTLKYKINCIIDYTLIPDHKERLEISSAWNEALVAAPKELRSHLFLFIDEAHKFAQKANSDPLCVRSKISLKQLSQTGRKRGIVTFFITQRVTHLHTDITAECNNFLIGKTTIDTDIRRNGELTRILSPKQQNIFKTLRKEFIVSGESFVHSEDDRLSSEIIKCTSNSPASKHGKENLNINDPLFYEPSRKVEEWIKILKGQQPKIEKQEEVQSVHKIRELRLKKMEQTATKNKEIVETEIDNEKLENGEKPENEPKFERKNQEIFEEKKEKKTELEWVNIKTDKIKKHDGYRESIIIEEHDEKQNNRENEKKNIDYSDNISYTMKNDVDPPKIIPTKPTKNPVEKSLSNDYNTTNASKIITENTFNVWFHIICFFECINLQNLYILSIRDDYSPIFAEAEIKLFCKQYKNLFVLQGDSIWFMPKNPNDENLKSKIELSKSDYFIKLWKHKINNINFERILMYLFQDGNCDNSYQEISEITHLDTKEIKKFVDIYSKCGLVKEIENCVYLNTIFFHSKIHDAGDEQPPKERMNDMNTNETNENYEDKDHDTTNGLDLNDPGFDDDDDEFDDDDDFDDDDFDDEDSDD